MMLESAASPRADQNWQPALKDQGGALDNDDVQQLRQAHEVIWIPGVQR